MESKNRSINESNAIGWMKHWEKSWKAYSLTRNSNAFNSAEWYLSYWQGLNTLHILSTLIFKLGTFYTVKTKILYI